MNQGYYQAETQYKPDSHLLEYQSVLGKRKQNFALKCGKQKSENRAAFYEVIIV